MSTDHHHAAPSDAPRDDWREQRQHYTEPRPDDRWRDTRRLPPPREPFAARARDERWRDEDDRLRRDGTRPRRNDVRPPPDASARVSMDDRRDDYRTVDDRRDADHYRENEEDRRPVPTPTVENDRRDAPLQDEHRRDPVDDRRDSLDARRTSLDDRLPTVDDRRVSLDGRAAAIDDRPTADDRHPVDDYHRKAEEPNYRRPDDLAQNGRRDFEDRPAAEADRRVDDRCDLDDRRVEEVQRRQTEPRLFPRPENGGRIDSDEERRTDKEDRAGDHDRRELEERREGDEHRTMEERRTLDERRVIEDRRPIDERRPLEEERRAVEERRPIDERRTLEERRPIEDRRPLDERRPIDEHRPLDDRRDDDRHELRHEPNGRDSIMPAANSHEVPSDRHAPPPRSDVSPPRHNHELRANNSHPPPYTSASASQSVNLFVRNVAKHVMEHQLMDLFSKYGQVESAVVVRDPHSKECRGFGFVKVRSDEDANKVIEVLQNFDFEGRQISVERAKRNEPHSRTPGTYLGMDRRIRDRYAGIKRNREYGGGPYDYAPAPYGGAPSHMSRPYSRDPDPMRPRYDGMGWGDSRGDQRGSYAAYPPRYDDRRGDERERTRRRYDDGAAAPPHAAPRYQQRETGWDHHVSGREPPVPRESAEDVI